MRWSDVKFTYRCLRNVTCIFKCHHYPNININEQWKFCYFTWLDSIISSYFVQNWLKHYIHTIFMAFNTRQNTELNAVIRSILTTSSVRSGDYLSFIMWCINRNALFWNKTNWRQSDRTFENNTKKLCI